jgi:DMSO reductase iron-sulfur subunit
MAQYGFLIDLSRCIGCNACVISCKQWHDIPPGPIKWMRVYQWEKGAFPKIDLRVLPIPCFHCEVPVCAEACPNKAIYKEDKYGAVLVDPDKCTGARQCWKACPYGAPQFAGDELGLKMSKCNMCVDRLADGLNPLCVLSCSMRALEFGPIDELIKKYGNVQRLEDMPRKEHAPCRIACPAGFKAEGYIELISEGKFDEAINQFREATPFVGVLGRTCTHPCETDCRRGQFDDAISICSLKRFMADIELKKGRKKVPQVNRNRGEKIAIIGSGPAGLQCAYDLTKLGYQVTVFEAAPRSGGLLRYGIPEYRLPKKILDDEISYIEEIGVEIKTNSPVKKIEDVFSQGYKAAFIAGGAWQSLRAGVSGENAKGIIYALDFLRQVNSGQKITIGNKIVVIGGGSVAIDSARTSLRLGAKEVHLVCLECRDLTLNDSMLAQDREIEEAEEEGVTIHPNLGIGRFLTKGEEVIGLETVNCISVKEDDGTFAPKFNGCSSLTLYADNVIIAIGQTIDKSALPDELKRKIGKVVSADSLTLQTEDKRIFAGGDMVSGPADIVSAVSSGKEAAISIDRYLRGVDLKQGRHLPPKSVRSKIEVKTQAHRVLDLAKRKSFTEVDLGFSKDMALEQSSRCLNCGTTVPSVVFKREMPKKQIIPWDFRKALQLWQKRHPASGEPLPDIYKSMSEVTQSSENFGGRNKLVLKAKNTEELMKYTTDDE